jgi:hypothetical protein
MDEPEKEKGFGWRPTHVTQILEEIRDDQRLLLKQSEKQTKLLEQIAEELTGPDTAVKIQFLFDKVSTVAQTKNVKEKQTMAAQLQLPSGGSDRFFILGKDANGNVGAQLAQGASIAVTSADPATVTVALDPTPQPTDQAGTLPDGTAVPAGTPTVASGTVAAVNPPAQPGASINITAQVTNADGTPGASQVGTVAVVAGIATSIGELFDTPVAVSAAKAKK